jgi:hypothetical protein
MNKKTHQIDFKRQSQPRASSAKTRRIPALSRKQWKYLGGIAAGALILILIGSYLTSAPTPTPQEAPKIKTVTIPLPPISSSGATAK